MKKVRLAENVKMVAVKNTKSSERLVDYYIVVPGRERIYAFTKRYTHGTYDLCKAGVRMNDLLHKRTTDRKVMELVEHTKFMMGYFIDYYELPVKKCERKKAVA